MTNRKVILLFSILFLVELAYSQVPGTSGFGFFKQSSSVFTIDQTFSYTGSDQAYVVPAGVTVLKIKVWAAGGGGSESSAGGSDGGAGGAGGYTEAEISVTPLESLTVVVGGGGVAGTANSRPGGGGGYSGILRTGTPLLISGAGGGAGGGGEFGSQVGGRGGAGGGSTGEAGVDGTGVNAGTGGGGGTQAAGGAAGTGISSANPGSSLQGGHGTGGAGGAYKGGGAQGNDNSRGGGGGGGYYGGGSGSEHSGGGGGSNYVTGSNTVSTQASASTAANNSDPDYIAGIGNGGDKGGLSTTATAGEPGLVFIEYTNTEPCPSSPSPGDVCAGGTFYLGSLSPGATSGSGTDHYMTTPGGCNDSATPTCSGTDSLTKAWYGSLGSQVDIPGLTNYTTTVGTGNGATNTDANYGSDNTPVIVAHASINPGSAADWCNDLVYGGYSDWHLPNRYELNLMYTNKASIPGLDTTGNWYWSSTEYDSNYVWGQRFSDGYQNNYSKNNIYRVRCVRRY